MADIFVRPYDQQRKSPKRFVLTAVAVLAVTLGVTAVWIRLDRSSESPAEPGAAADSQSASAPAPSVSAPAAPAPAGPAPVASAPAPSATVPVPAAPAAPATAGDVRAQQLFAKAQNLAAAGSLLQAREMLSEVMTSAASESLKNNALRVQGRLNVQLLLSADPSPDKKTYIIQPGDSLDRIARQNKTTVELLRKMNRLDGSTIYPGGRLAMPAGPFVARVSKSLKALDLMLEGRIFKRYIVGLGVHGKTPVGHFVTVVHQTNPDWTPPGGGIIPFGDPRNILGTRWMSIQDSTRPEIRGFGIHGTPLRDSIGADTSNGCVRMLNEDVEELYLLIPRGTDVIISE